jgi:hypothetical protein
VGGLSITGYVLEPPRVGGANSPYTSTPDVYIYDQGAFDTAYPSDESAPRTEYCVFVKEQGDLHEAVFFWTKNEVISRFDYDSRDQRFRPLYGAPRTELGVLVPEPGGSNTTRLQGSPPLSTDTVDFPLRVAVGSALSGITFPVTVVATDLDFGSPSSGDVEISQATGNLNWNAGDLTTFGGQEVFFQRQTFFTTDESNGNIGTLGGLLWLNPIPKTGQFPLVRIGFAAFLTPVEVANEAAFTPPAGLAAGTFEWAVTTGRLNFSQTDLTNFPGKPIYSEGVVFSFGVSVETQAFGTVGSPAIFGTLPPEASDVYFRLPNYPATDPRLQFPETRYVGTFSSVGERNVVEVNDGSVTPGDIGKVQFSYVDQLLYGPQAVLAVIGDLIIERGMKLRLFRSPVDLTAINDDVKDATAFYETTGATMADPIIRSPFVSLPAIPFEEIPPTLEVRVEQGTGTFVGTLDRLDVGTPTAGYGYVLNSEDRQINYARHRVEVVTEGSDKVPFSSVALQDPLIFESNLLLELQNPAGGPYQPLTLGEDAIINYTGGLVTLTHTSGVLYASGSGVFAGTLLTDIDQDFLAANVIQGDMVLVPSGAAAGVYTVDVVLATSLTLDLSGGAVPNVPYEVRRGEGAAEGREILADRYFQEVSALDPNTRVERLTSMGAASNGPRLSIPALYIDAATTRFRFGSDTFATWGTVVNDAAFTPPASLAEDTIEVSLSTGNLNFSSANIGETVFLARTQTLGTDYRIQPGLGFIELTERTLENEEIFITYAVLDDDGNKVVVEERGTFIVRKELHNTASPSSVITFNPLGRQVADQPEPQAFRGGRPQVNGEQVSFDTAASTCTFLADDQITDALPHGAIVDPSEDVFIDYYIHDAIGGEKSLTVLQPPMVGVDVQITEGEQSFFMAGDRTADFQVNHLLRIDKEEIYSLSGSTYDAGADLTEVSLATGSFQTDYRNPALAVTSGPTRISSFFLTPAYFVTEAAAYDTTPRGGNLFRLAGDQTGDYVQNTIIYWTDGVNVDFNRVEGSTYDPETLKTEVVLSSNGIRQYTYGVHTLKRSVRPILETPQAVLQTSRVLLGDLPYIIYRRVEGQVGQVLQEPDGYSIDPTGRITFVDPMQPSEELGIFYTGNQVYDDGRNFRATYTHSVAPTQSNGLQNQILKADYTTYMPDSSFWRVETFTNFRGELAQQYEDSAKAAVPTGGPVLENASSPKLYEQGRESVFYNEGRLANEDEVARATLKYFNDGIDWLEDCLQDMDGRVVGDHDGRFLFDGNIDNPVRATFADVTNQIDDILKVADPPLSFSFSPFTFTWLGTYQEVYKAANFSRFFTTYRPLYGVAATGDPPGPPPETGTTILDTGFTDHRSTAAISRRLPWAVVTDEAVTGSVTINVDTTEEQEDLIRPKWDPATYPGMLAVIQDRDGTWLHDRTTVLTVASVTATSITFGAGVAVDIPVGATIRHIESYDPVFAPSPPVNPYLKVYRAGFDVAVDLKEGVLLYVRPYPPFDGTFPGIPTEMEIQPPGDGEPLDVFTFLNVIDTSPYRAPVFDGGTADDDGNRQFPILSPWPDSEAGSGVGTLGQQTAAIANIQVETTPPFIGTGDLSVGNTRITNQGGGWPVPTPKLYDLVTINDGVNGPSSFHRITALDPGGPGTINVAPAFANPDTGFNFTITTSVSKVVSPTGTVGPITRLTDPAGNYYGNNVRVGHTVVFTSGPHIGTRRQVTAIVSGTQLDIDAAAGLGGPWTYRVDDSVPTYGGTGSHLDDLVPPLDDQLAVLDTNTPPGPYSERLALEGFFDQVFVSPDVVTSSNGETVSSAVLTDNTVDFVAAGVNATHFVFIRSGASAGIYQVLDPPAPTANTLEIDGVFPDTAIGISYRIVSVDGVTRPTLESLYAALVNVDTEIADTTTFRALVTTPVTVNLDGAAFARRTTNTDLNNRLTGIAARETALTDPAGDAANISNAMSAGDKLYDRRFVWIDARINTETGILPKKDRAVSDRIKQQAEIVKQLTKLLSVETT